MTAHPPAERSTPTQPTIIVDTREQAPLPLRFPTIRAALPVGDYGVARFSDWSNPQFIVERKSLSDLCASLGRQRVRFIREVERLRQFRFRALVIEATPDQIEEADYRSQIAPASVMGTLNALQVRVGLHVVWAGSPQGAARQVEQWARMLVGGIYADYERITNPIERR